MSEDSLHFLPPEKWCELLALFKKDLPRSISACTVLETQQKLLERGFDYGFKVYCPFGDMENGMVALNIKDQIHEVIIQCPQDNTEKLEDALKTTTLIDWNKSIKVPFAPHHIIKCVQNVMRDNKVGLLFSDTFVLEKQDEFNVSLPSDINFDLVTLDHLELVDTTWPYHTRNTASYFKLLINMKGGYGLFKNGNLIAWVFVNESGNLVHLYTVKTERRKGYAELLMKLVSNILREEERPVVAFCVKDNYNAYEFYTKLGYEKRQEIAWCYINKSKV